MKGAKEWAQPLATNCLITAWWNHISIINSLLSGSVFNDAVWRKHLRWWWLMCLEGRLVILRGKCKCRRCICTETDQRFKCSPSFMTMISFNLSCEGWAGWSSYMTYVLKCVSCCFWLESSVNLSSLWPRLMLSLHSERHQSSSIVSGCYLWFHIDWVINQQVSVGPEIASWQRLKVYGTSHCGTYSNRDATFHITLK